MITCFSAPLAPTNIQISGTISFPCLDTVHPDPADKSHCCSYGCAELNFFMQYVFEGEPPLSISFNIVRLKMKKEHVFLLKVLAVKKFQVKQRMWIQNWGPSKLLYFHTLPLPSIVCGALLLCYSKYKTTKIWFSNLKAEQETFEFGSNNSF